MEKSFPIKEVTYKGEKYVEMKSEVFHSFFLELMKYQPIDESIIDAINNKYKKAKAIKRKRIKLKKEKEVLSLMYDIMIKTCIKS